MTMPSVGRLFVALALLHTGALAGAAAGADVPDAAPAPAATAWVTPVMRGPGVTHHTFESAAAGTLAERNARAIAAGSRVRIVIGDADETFANNRDFHEHLAALGIPHDWTVLPGIGHDPVAVLDALGDDNWAFCRAAFGAGAAAPAPAAR